MPNRQKIILLAIPVLTIGLIGVWWPQVRKIFRSEKVSMNLTTIDQKKLHNIHRLIDNSSIVKSSPESEFKDWGRDPFNQTAIAPSPEVDPFPLKGIFWDEDRPSALIGETVVYVGDRINNFTVTNIQPDMVVISDGHKVIKLQLAN